MNQKIISCILLLGILFSCKPPLLDVVYTMHVKNNSSKKIYVLKADLSAEKQYPDVSLPFEKPLLRKVESGKYGYFYSDLKWEKQFSVLPADTLSIFLFDGDVFENEDWNVIRDNYLILKRYDLSLEDMKQLNYEIVYP